MKPVGFVVGLKAEADLIGDLGPAVVGREDAVRELAGQVRALVSFGLAGGLHPRLLPGYLAVPRNIRLGRETFPCDPDLMACFGGSTCELLLASDNVIATRGRKEMLFQSTEAAVVDMESGITLKIAREAGLPFAALRAICDPANRSVPEVARYALDEEGRIRTKFILKSLAVRPWEIVDLLKLARDAAKARRALKDALDHYRKHGVDACRN